MEYQDLDNKAHVHVGVQLNKINFHQIAPPWNHIKMGPLSCVCNGAAKVRRGFPATPACLTPSASFPFPKANILTAGQTGHRTQDRSDAAMRWARPGRTENGF